LTKFCSIAFSTLVASTVHDRTSIEHLGCPKTSCFQYGYQHIQLEPLIAMQGQIVSISMRYHHPAGLSCCRAVNGEAEVLYSCTITTYTAVAGLAYEDLYKMPGRTWHRALTLIRILAFMPDSVHVHSCDLKMSVSRCSSYERTISPSQREPRVSRRL
jgi:hypothetical protein